MPSAFDAQLRAGRGQFEQQRKEGARTLEQTLLETWGTAAENWGLTTGGIARITEAGQRGYASGMGGVDSAERMWMANSRRAEEARKSAERGNLGRTIGTGAGMLAGLLLALPTGGTSLAVTLAAMSAGGGLGAFAGGLAAGGDTSDLPATMVASLNAAGSAYHIGELLKLQKSLAETGYLDSQQPSRLGYSDYKPLGTSEWPSR